VVYEVVFDEEALDFLDKLPKDVKERIFNKVVSTKENPFHFFERLEGRKDYKLKIGDIGLLPVSTKVQEG